MKITADTNVLVRAIVGDDVRQEAFAIELLANAELVVIPVAALCEFVWVTRQAYRRTAAEVARTIRVLLNTTNVQVDRNAAAAGLAMLDAGGDFADGVIAYDGRRLGGDVFASFDRAAVRLIAATGPEARLLGDG